MMLSAVRLPTPPPQDPNPSTYNPRKRSPPSRSPSPVHRRSPPRNGFGGGSVLKDARSNVADERERHLTERLRQRAAEPVDSKPLTAEDKQELAKKEYNKLLSARSGGTYVPPARLRALQSQVTDKASKEYQRMAWEALKKSINGLVNKINVGNIKNIVPELFGENLIRGKGLFCRSIQRSQAQALPFSPVYAAMVAIVNTKLPQVGELLVKRLIVQFKKAFKRNDKPVLIASTTFLAQLTNVQVCHEMIAAQILLLLLHHPTDDSVEIAVNLTRECGQHLEEMNPAIANAIFDQFRHILNDSDIETRTQYMIEVLFQVRKDKYKDNVSVPEDLDLVEEEDQITHRIGLDDELDVEDGLNIFKYDAEFEEHEEAYRKLKSEILGEADGEDDGDEYESGSGSESGPEETAERELEIKDQTNTDLVNLRRTIYLTIMSSIDFEEACHKLMKITLPAGQESELPSMIVECCSQEKTYSKFFGLLGERFAKLNRLWATEFEASFEHYFSTIHRFETNRLRNIARFWGHMLSSDATGWHVLSIIHLNEEETTSSSRIFIKILIQDLAEALGMAKLQARLKDPLQHSYFEGLFPLDNPRNTRFSINYFTSIGMGGLTEDMREHLKNAPKPAAVIAPPEPESDSESSVSSYSSYSSYMRPRGRYHVHHRAREQHGAVNSPQAGLERLHEESLVEVERDEHRRDVALGEHDPLHLPIFPVPLRLEENAEGEARHTRLAVAHHLRDQIVAAEATVEGRRAENQASSQQQPAVDINSFYQEEASRRRSPGRKGQGKSRRKNETGGEDTERSAWGLPQELTSPPSILSQLHASMPPPPSALSNGVPSPRLEAWDASSPTRKSDVPGPNTTEWAQNIPYGRSPPREYSNGASRAGSPPEYRQALDPELRGGFSHTSPPTSPRAAYRQPVQRTNEYQSFGNYMGSSPPNRRPLSMNSQNSHYPPAPHHQQAHYYAAPEIDLGHPKPVPDDRVPGEGFCCVFDSLSSSGQETSGTTENVLLVGFDHGLNIYQVGKKHFDPVGRLEGLRGSVIGAKILHSQCISDKSVQPLVAVVVHGPFVSSGASSKPGINAVIEEFEPSRSEMQALQVAATTHYQTTVEIYSLRKGQHMGTLFRSPKVEFEGGTSHIIVPPPVGDLSIQAKGRFLIIGSGISGEVFIFERTLHGSGETSPSFRCIGKVWTRTGPQKTRSVSTSSNESGPTRLHDALAAGTRRSNAVILSLSNRWLAIAPPSSSAQSTLNGIIESDGSGQQAPGVSSHAPTVEPQISCDLETPEGEGLLNKAARDIAQGFLKTAQWVGSEGKQAWSNYWSKSSEQNQQGSTVPLSNPGLSALPNQQGFPPTHAQDNLVNRARNLPALVSILDLEKLSNSLPSKNASVLQPLATFSLPTGCSLLSFSPNGLHLLTASAKGDVEHVWDLMRMVHGEPGRAGDLDVSPKSPSVRQIAKITRMTEARIVDVVWTEPKGDRLAIITDRGTVHINDLPSSAFLWPPPRRILRSTTTASNLSATSATNDDTIRPASAGAGTTFSSAFGVFTGKTQPLFDAVRGRRPSIGSGFSGFGGMTLTAGIGAKSGRAVAAGFNRSVGAAATGTVNTIRHLGENRIALPSSQSPVVPGCVRWLSGKGLGRIAITGGGLVRIYSIRQSSNSKPRQRRPSVFGDRPVEFSLPKEPGLTQHIPSKQLLISRSPPEPSIPRGSFWLPQSALPVSSTSKLETHPLSYAELDTSLAYQPFHTDRRVNLYVYGDDVTSVVPTSSPGTSTWIFGEPIPATKISIGSTGHEDADANLEQATPSRMENVISMKGNVEEGQQIVVTTRRKRSAKNEGIVAGAQDEIFEDDCEILDFAEERV